MENVSCPVCGTKDEIELWTKRGARYVRCRKCSLVYENPRLTTKELKELYSNEAYYIQKPSEAPNSGYENYLLQCTPQLQTEYFEIVQRFARVKTGRFLDVGCGTGGVVAAAETHGWEAIGQEISDWAVVQGRKNGISIVNATLPEAHFRENYFNALSMFDVLEHLPSPVEYLKELYRILAPDGVLIIETPNINGFFARYLYKENSDLVKPRAHICLFNPSSAKRLCANAPFSEVLIEAFPYCRKFTLGYFKGVIATRILPKRTPMQLTLNESLRIICWK